MVNVPRKEAQFRSVPPQYDISDQQEVVVLIVPFTGNCQGHLVHQYVLILV